MKTTPENPPAFPNDEPDINAGHYEGRYEILAHHPGMSLRDWFAGQWAANQKLGSDGYDNSAHIAIDAYFIADAMLTARQTNP